MFPLQNPFEGVPIRRIDTETYLSIARHLVDNIRTAGVNRQILVKELNTCIRELEQIINNLDNNAEQLSGRCDGHYRIQLQQIQDDRDK